MGGLFGCAGGPANSAFAPKHRLGTGPWAQQSQSTHTSHHFQPPQHAFTCQNWMTRQAIWGGNKSFWYSPESKIVLSSLYLLPSRFVTYDLWSQMWFSLSNTIGSAMKSVTGVQKNGICKRMGLRAWWKSGKYHYLPKHWGLICELQVTVDDKWILCLVTRKRPLLSATLPHRN